MGRLSLRRFFRESLRENPDKQILYVTARIKN